eukprot:scaffold10547_cov58-Phaeocystis_antarctica.AAC.5
MEAARTRRLHEALVAALKSNLTLADDGDLQREQGGGGDTAEGGAETPADNLAVWRAFARRPKGAKGESGVWGSCFA